MALPGNRQCGIAKYREGVNGFMKVSAATFGDCCRFEM